MKTPSQPGSRLAPSARWALTSLSLATLMASLDTSIAHTALPTLSLALSASFAQVQWIVLAYLLVVTTLIVSAGRLGDRLGRRRVLMLGIGIFTLASLFCGAAPSLGWLVAARAMQGLGAAIMLALTLALVGEVVPKSQTGATMGLLGSMSAIGTTLGPSLGGVLIASFGWPSIFLVNVPLGLLNLLLAYLYLPADPPRTQRGNPGFDLPGTLLLALALAAYALAMTLGNGVFGLLNAVLLLGAACGVGLFVRWEKKAVSPLIRLALLRDGRLRAGLGMNALVSTVMMSTLVVGPFYLAQGLGLNAMLVGLLLSVGPCVSALTGVPAGRSVDRLGAPRMIVCGLGAMVLGATTLALLPASVGVVGYLAPLLIITAGYAVFQAGNNTRILSAIDSGQRGVVSGLLSLSRNLGLITGAAFMGAVFAFASAHPDLTSSSPEAVSTGMRVTFAVAVVLIMLAMGLALQAFRGLVGAGKA